MNFKILSATQILNIDALLSSPRFLEIQRRYYGDKPVFRENFEAMFKRVGLHVELIEAASRAWQEDAPKKVSEVLGGYNAVTPLFQEERIAALVTTNLTDFLKITGSKEYNIADLVNGYLLEDFSAMYQVLYLSRTEQKLNDLADITFRSVILLRAIAALPAVDGGDG